MLATPPETDDQRRDRHLSTLKRIAAIGMQLVEDVAELAREAVATQRAPAKAPARQPNYLALFARLAAVVRGAIALEHRIACPRPLAKPAPIPLPPDKRRAALREALYPLTKSEPDRATRNQLCRMIDEQIETELRADPDHKLPLAEPFIAICKELGFPYDITKMTDAFLGIKPRTFLDLHPTATPPPIPETS